MEGDKVACVANYSSLPTPNEPIAPPFSTGCTTACLYDTVAPKAERFPSSSTQYAGLYLVSSLKIFVIFASVCVAFVSVGCGGSSENVVIEAPSDADPMANEPVPEP